MKFLLVQRLKNKCLIVGFVRTYPFYHQMNWLNSGIDPDMVMVYRRVFEPCTLVTRRLDWVVGVRGVAIVK